MSQQGGTKKAAARDGSTKKWKMAAGRWGGGKEKGSRELGRKKAADGVNAAAKKGSERVESTAKKPAMNSNGAGKRGRNGTVPV